MRMLGLLLTLSFVCGGGLFAEVSVSGLNGMRGVDVNRGNACAWGYNSEYYCWGTSDGGLHGTNDYTEKGLVPYARRSILSHLQGENNRFVDMSVGSTGACGVRADGLAICWGPFSLRLGSGYQRPILSSHGHYPSPVSFPGDDLTNRADDVVARGFVSVDLGRARTHTCGVRELEGVRTAWCWGSSDSGALGNGMVGRSYAPYPVQVMRGAGDPLMDVASVHVEDLHVCAVTQTDGHVYCWGRNNLGLIGGGSMAGAIYPYATQVRVGWNPSTGGATYLSGVTDMAVGRYHNCAVTDARELWCWGDGYNGALGNGNIYGRSAVAVRGHMSRNEPLADVSGVALAQSATCIIQGASKQVMCFGQHSNGVLGNGAIEGNPVLFPENVLTASPDGAESVPLDNVISISGNESSMCAVVDGRGQVYCWGSNRTYLLGNAETDRLIRKGLAGRVLRADAN